MRRVIMHRQRGLSVSGFLFWAVIVVFAVLLGFKLAPAYMEYLTIQKQFKAIAGDPAMNSAQRPAIERAFYNRTTIENIQAVTPQDLEITKDGDQLVIRAAYSVRVPLVANISACIDFNPSSEK